jgi:hypothetical protein
MLLAVIIAVPVMMWTITIFIRSYGPKTPTFRHLTSTEPLLTATLPPKPQAAQSAPLLTDAARPAGDGVASPPDPNSESLNGPAGPAETAPNAPAVASGEAATVTNSAQSLALPPVDAPPSAASPTGPAETAPNAPAVASGEAAAVTNSAQSAATAETASSEAVTPVQRHRLTATGPATVSIAPVGPVPLPRVRPVDAPVDTPSVPSSPPSGSPLLAHPAAYGYQPGLESGR